MPHTRIRILMVEDDALFRMGLGLAIRNHPDLELVGEAEDGESALDLAGRTSPHIVLLDIGLPGWGGQQTLSRLKRNYPAVRVLVLTSHEEAKLVQAMLQAGADGYCLKGIAPDHLATVIKEVNAGHGWFDSKVVNHLRKAMTKEMAHTPGLTEREREILQWIARGATNPEIGHKLHISDGTVRVHVHAILRKLGAVDRTQAAVIAQEQGLLD